MAKAKKFEYPEVEEIEAEVAALIEKAEARKLDISRARAERDADYQERLVANKGDHRGVAR